MDVTFDFAIRVSKQIGGKEKFTDVGVAYKNARGSITCYLAGYPLDDKIFLYPTEEVEEQEEKRTQCQPKYLVRYVKDVGGKDKWYDLGVAYERARGKLVIYLYALPAGDKLLLIPFRD